VSQDHYNMINLNKKSDVNEGSPTIEFRMFKGVIEPLLFHKNLEFVQAIFNFTKDHSKKEMYKKYFLAYLIKHKNQYSCLMEYLKSKLDIKSFSGTPPYKIDWS